jgi:large subunit ribosomal protein L23
MPREHLKLIVSEKSAEEIKGNKYTFKVDKDLNKIEIKQIIKNQFGVDAVMVNTSIKKGKTRRRGRTIGIMPDVKKAVVTLAPGQKIEAYKNAF